MVRPPTDRLGSDHVTRYEALVANLTIAVANATALAVAVLAAAATTIT